MSTTDRTLHPPQGEVRLLYRETAQRLLSSMERPGSPTWHATGRRWFPDDVPPDRQGFANTPTPWWAREPDSSYWPSQAGSLRRHAEHLGRVRELPRHRPCALVGGRAKR